MAATTTADLDRCPHGRHRGDVCAGWRASNGPGIFTSGCRGGYSLGNPWPMAGSDRIGTTIYGDPIMPGDVDGPAPGWLRARFHANPDDYRPVKWPPPGPYWCSGEGDGYSVVVAYLRPEDRVTDWWPEASEVDTEEADAIVFTGRFPRPDWWAGMDDQ